MIAPGIEVGQQAVRLEQRQDEDPEQLQRLPTICPFPLSRRFLTIPVLKSCVIGTVLNLCKRPARGGKLP